MNDHDAESRDPDWRDANGGAEANGDPEVIRPPAGPDGTEDDRLHDLLEEWEERHLRGEDAVPESLAAADPALIEALRERIERQKRLYDFLKLSPSQLAGAGSLAAPARLPTIPGFRIVREVGRGGMGVVYEAEQESLGRRVALKVLPASILSDARQVRRFELEARSAARLHHTNIVPVFGVGQHEGTHFYVMQFIQGQGLDTVLEELRRLRLARSTKRATIDPGATPGRRAAAEIAVSLANGRFAAGADGQTVSLDGTLPYWPEPASDGPGSGSSPSHPGRRGLAAESGISGFSEADRRFAPGVARIGLQVAEALAHAHGQGILHRDIKPSNLLLDGNGNVWVADFGLAKAVGADDLTNTGDIIGTVRYMAPERFRGAGDARADLYALGLTLYELLALRPAFEEKDRAGLIRQVTGEEPPRLRALNRAVPADLETVVHKAMAREPDHRYATAGALAEDLRRFLEGRPILARRASPAERAWRWCQRNKAVAGLMTMVFILLAAVAVVASVGYVREASARASAERHRVAAQAAEARAKDEADRASTAEQEMQLQWYAASINLMQPAWDAGQVGRLHALLEETEAYPARGFEWSYWQRLCHLERQTLIGHRSGVKSVSWSPDGKRLATASWDMTARVWDAVTGRELVVLQGHTSGIHSVAWSPDGTRLATASVDGTAKVWPAEGGRAMLTLEGHSAPIHSVAWSPDGTRLATGSQDGTARIWKAGDGRQLREIKSHAGVVLCVAWSSDGTRLATGGRDRTARIWDAADGRPIRTLEGHVGEVWSVSWSPDGTRLATGSDDATAKLWDAQDGRERLSVKGHNSRVMSVAWSPDSRRLATESGDGTAQVWQADDGRPLLALKGHVIGVSSVAWSPDGTRLATGSEDGTAKVWDAAASRERLALDGNAGGIMCVAWSPDGTRLATGSYIGATKVWDTVGGRERLAIKSHTGRVMSMAWSPDGTRLATAGVDGTTKVWDPATGYKLLSLEGHTGEMWSVSWSPDGTRLATASWDRTARIWDAATGHPLVPLVGHTGEVDSVAWSPDGRRLATGGRDRTARIWDAADGRLLVVLTGHRSEVCSVAWSPDGTRLATASHDRTARVWDAADGGERLALEGHAGAVFSVAWSRDGTRLATGSLDTTAKVWNVADGRELLTLKGHAGRVNAVCCSPNGLRLATGSYDGTTKVWDAAGTEAAQQWARQDRAVVDLLARGAYRGPKAHGFIRDWLLLLPLPLAPGELGAQGLVRQQLPGEADLQPRPGDRVPGRGDLVWREYRSPESVLDLNAVVGQATVLSVGYAACYIETDRARDDLWLQVGSDDQSLVYLNGREIYRCRVPRTLASLDTAGPVALRRGTNVLLLKVVNEGSDWEACVRLVDGEGRPAEGIRVKRTP